MHILKERSLWLLHGGGRNRSRRNVRGPVRALLQEPDDENWPHGNDGAVHTEADGYRIILERESTDGNGLRQGEGSMKNES